MFFYKNGKKYRALLTYDLRFLKAQSKKIERNGDSSYFFRKTASTSGCCIVALGEGSVMS